MRFHSSVALLAFACPAIAATDQVLPPIEIMRLPDAGQAQRYCGLYCVVAAGKLYNKPVNLDALFRPEFVTGEFGSTVDELCRASRIIGLESEARTGMFYWDLCGLNDPVICLIKPALDLPFYSHWLMIMKAGPEHIELFDPSAGMVTTSPAKFMALWDGVGIIVSPSGRQASTLPFARYIDQVLVLFSGLAICYWLLRIPLPWATGPRGLARIVMAAVVMTALYQVLIPFGLANNMAESKKIAASFHHVKTRHVTLKETRGRGGLLFIDARMPAAFNGGHIPGAMNVPINSTEFLLDRQLSSLPPDQPIVVYCTSEHCNWAEDLAGRAALRKFHDVSVLAGGYEEYGASGLPIGYQSK
jgi:rhodanese-related sulfurtransferase